MNNILIGVKRFFKNKNTVTIFAVILCLIIIYFAYSYRIKKATEPTMVPYATRNLEPRTLITADMVGTRKVPGSIVTANVITEPGLIVGKYVSNQVEIPNNSLFYANTLLTWEELPRSIYGDIPEGNTIVALPVSLESTYGNSIFPGNYIDLYYSGTDYDGKILVGKYIESIRVMTVTDSSFNNIFEKTSGMDQPYYLIFNVPEDMHLLLRKTMYVGGTLFPVPRNANYSENPKETRIVSSYIQNLILSKTVDVKDEDLKNINVNGGKINANQN